MLRKVFMQLAILAAVSVLSGFWFTTFGVNFFVGVATGVLLQFGGFYFITTLLNVYVALKNKKLENERLKEFSYQGLEVTCPCFKQAKQIVPIRLNTSNYYRCAECNKSVSVIVDATTASVTEPISNTALPSFNEELLKNISNANS
jgi:hypothetical protein